MVCPSAFPETLTRPCSSTSSAGSMLSSKARPSQEQRRPLMGGINKSSNTNEAAVTRTDIFTVNLIQFYVFYTSACVMTQW